jgi:ectoine hydroxylase-related dioxygenase (phytanoyl-CoA dioxygenase family)
MTTTDPTAPAVLDEETISAYRRDGVVRIRNIISTEQAARFRDAAIAVSASAADYSNGSPIFKQHVNVWRDDAVLRELTLDPRLAAAATALAGVPVRIWHDQLLIKPPHNGAATEFHQDAPYWPHAGSRASLSAWVVQDVHPRIAASPGSAQPGSGRP